MTKRVRASEGPLEAEQEWTDAPVNSVGCHDPHIGSIHHVPVSSGSAFMYLLLRSRICSRSMELLSFQDSLLDGKMQEHHT